MFTDLTKGIGAPSKRPFAQKVLTDSDTVPGPRNLLKPLVSIIRPKVFRLLQPLSAKCVRGADLGSVQPISALAEVQVNNSDSE